MSLNSNLKRRNIKQQCETPIKRLITGDLRELRRAIFEEEIRRAESVIVRCTNIENLYAKTSTEAIDNERRISNIYDEAKKQADIEEKKRHEDSNTYLLAYKNYFASIKEKLHTSTKKAMLAKINNEEKNEKLIQDKYKIRWETLDNIECKRRESAKCFYLHAQEQYIVTLNNIIYTESQAKLAFANYNSMMDSVDVD